MKLLMTRKKWRTQRKRFKSKIKKMNSQLKLKIIENPQKEIC